MLDDLLVQPTVPKGSALFNQQLVIPPYRFYWLSDQGTGGFPRGR